MYLHKQNVEETLKMSLKALKTYEWLLDLYVLDFFVDNHWEKLPGTWRESLQDIDPQELGKVLTGMPTKHTLPLSLLALIKLVSVLSIPRQYLLPLKKNTEDDVNGEKCGTHLRLKNLFLKHVKLKKRHEISVMSEVVQQVALQSDCGAVLDFGSGLGHLVRMLAYKHDLYTAGIECQTQLTEEARKLDLELEYTASKHLSEESMSSLKRPLHLNMTLSCNKQLHHLELPDTMTYYGLIGLHPCGDLGPLLLNHFVNNDRVKFICLVGCCYMKLTCDGESAGYPLSKYMKKFDCKLCYPSREISCHAIEVYCERLRKGNYEDLKVHAYRAAFERILINHNPNLRHAPVRSIKHTESMTFEKYCRLALERIDIPFPTAPEVWAQGAEDLSQWRRVVTVYTLRLALAPLVETIILLDRVLYVLEAGLSCKIHPVFNPKISPRNHIIIARR